METDEVEPSWETTWVGEASILLGSIVPVQEILKQPGVFELEAGLLQSTAQHSRQELFTYPL